MQDSGGLNDKSQDDLGTESPIDSIKKIAESEVKKQRTLELAIVKNIYPHKSGKDNDNYECDVELKNGGSELRKVPILTPHIGFSWVPNVNDLVLIGYIGGNVNSPVVLGSLYNDDQRPPLNNANVAICSSGKGGFNKLRFTFGKDHQWSILGNKGMAWQASDSELVVSHSPKAPTNFTTMRSIAGAYRIGGGSDGNVYVEGTSCVVVGVYASKVPSPVTTPAEQILITADKDITIKCGGELKLKAGKITIESDTDLKLNGTSTVAIESKGTMSVKANVQLDLQGNPVNIN
jgi:phage baseplate assembly protein gpV